MSAFYIASGFGFRKRSIGKCVQQQLRGILPPFLYTALATAGLHLLLHPPFLRLLDGRRPQRARRSWPAFCWAFPHTSTYFGMSIFSCGPMWYLLTMAVGWIILDILFNALPLSGTYPPQVAITAVLGWGTCLVWELPFCLSQGMTVVPDLYLGHVAKKRRWFDQPPPALAIPRRPCVCMVVSAGGAILSGTTDNMSMGHWALGPVGIFVNGMIGLWIVNLFVRLSARGRQLPHPHSGSGGPPLPQHLLCPHHRADRRALVSVCGPVSSPAPCWAWAPNMSCGAALWR